MNQLPHEIIEIVITYMVPQRYIVRDGIDPNRIFLETSRCNYHSVNDTLRFPPVIYNSDGVLYMVKNDTRLTCMDFMIRDTTTVLVDNQWCICEPDDTAMRYMMSFPEKMDLKHFCKNKHTVLVQYLLDHPTIIAWDMFSMNPNPLAISYLLRHKENVRWSYFCQNSSMEAVDFLIQHPEYIEWYTFSQHPLVYLLVDDIVLQIEWSTVLTQKIHMM